MTSLRIDIDQLGLRPGATKRRAIMEHLIEDHSHSISPMEAIGLFKDVRLAADVEVLRKKLAMTYPDYEIITHRKTARTGDRYARYELVRRTPSKRAMS